MSAAIQSCTVPAVMPIVFIPGIMGSRLRNKSTGRIVWNPDNYSDFSDFLPDTSGSGSIARQMRNGAAGKRRALVAPPGGRYSPNYLEVYPGRAGTERLPQIRIDRGWGGVHQGSYHSFLMWLQYSAPNQHGGVLPRGCMSLRYEVWVHPYNWTDDNTESGRRLAETVSRAQSQTATQYVGGNIKVLKPVIVTHSMGGFVSRAYTQIHGGAGNVQGVIHGAMPTDGAPATYKRMVAGFEGISRFALGSDQIQVTATAGNCPGPLQLLPNKRHRNSRGQYDWLRTSSKSGNTLWQRPAGNPYAEIYVNRRDWWRLVDERYLDPDGDPDGKLSWAGYIRELTKAATYHERLGAAGYHPNTRMFWGNDQGNLAWDKIEWRQTARSDTPPAGREFYNDNRGVMQWGEWYQPPVTPWSPVTKQVFLADCRYVIQGPNAPGDGTVHTGSGRYVSGPMSQATTEGFEHQSAFSPSSVRRLVAAWLLEMVQEQL